MKRDSVKTAVGLVIIGGIVVATFLYGNAQRQSQLRQDQAIKTQQAKEAAASPSVSASASVKPTSAPAPAVIDGGQVGPTVIPDTGATENGLFGLTAIALAGILWRESKTRVRQSVRVRN